MTTVVSYPVTTDVFTRIDFNYLMSQRIDMNGFQNTMSTALLNLELISITNTHIFLKIYFKFPY